MVEAAVSLNKAFRGVKGMVSKVKICVNKEGAQLADASYESHKGRRVLTINALFDGGADGGGFDENIIDLLDSLESRRIAVGTAIGTNVKEYNRAKLKLVGNRFQEEVIHNMSAIGLGRIGVDKNNTRTYVTKLCELFGYNENFKQHFESQVTEQAERVYAVIGQRSSSQLLIDLTVGDSSSLDPAQHQNLLQSLIKS